MIEFVKALTAATETGKARWTSESNTGFTLAQKSGAVRIQSLESDGEWPYRLSLHDDKGATIEVLTSTGPEDDNAPQDLPLRALYVAARSQALNIDGVVAGILKELGVSPDDIKKVTKPGFDPDEIPF
jgi:hypothetical protein